MDSSSSRLKTWMEENSMEVKELAQQIDFNPYSIYKFLNDERPASWEFQHRFALVFGLGKTAEIFGDSNVERAAA